MWLLGDKGFCETLKIEKIPGLRMLLAVINAVISAMESGRSGNSTELLIRVRDSNFFKDISMYLNSLNVLLHHEDLTSLIEQLVLLLDIYMSLLPTDSADIVSLLITIIESKVAGGLALAQNVQEKIEAVKLQIANRDVTRSIKQLKIDKKNDNGINNNAPTFPDVAPPEDFRTISIFPSVSDFEEKEIFLRKNLVGTAYKDRDTYLDVQFRLIREDFIRPLREGILEYKHCLQTGERIKNKDVRVYEDARIMFPDISLSGEMTYQIKFSLKGLQSVRWENSKRLIYGSLVCLSSDGFTTFIFATIKNRDSDKLKDGIVDVVIECEEKVEFENTYVMVESSTYFEAYRHVLKSLQEVGEDLPFQRYIVGQMRKSEDDMEIETEDKLDVTIQCPRYLPGDAQYDLAPLMRKMYRRVGKEVYVRNDSKWPDESLMTLDDSQLAAVKNALTREVAIVQGPPGTGKTYIGLKIAEVLLLNHQYWNKNRGPILVLCYTNHALDQFLEGILRFNKSIVRVGSRSKNPALEDYSLANLRRKSDNRNLPRDIRANFFNIRAQKDELEEEMREINVRIEASRNHLFSEKELEPFMGNALEAIEDGLQNAFQLVSRRKQKSSIQEWLGLGATFAEPNAKNLNMHNNEEGVNEDEGNIGTNHTEEALIDIEEDAKREHEQRFIDLEGEPELDEDALKQLKEKKERIFNNLDLINIDCDDTNGEWQISKKEKKRRMKKVTQELNKRDIMDDRQRRAAERQPWELNLQNRWRLYRTWIRDFINKHQIRHEEVRGQYIHQLKRLEETKEMEVIHILSNAKVVGMTTTGAAKLHSVVKKINSPIMIVEEAAEVFEAHIVSSLTESCQHLILIGDHQQLRPNPTVYELCRKYNLDVSLFERLIKNGLSHNRLDIQHRMLPAISKLLVPHIYKDLLDHKSVKDYPNIKGVASNVFFIDHAEKEAAVQDGNSKSNLHEATFLIELCRYFLKQGYEPEKITILTTYSGQLFVFKNHMPKKEFEGVRVTTVDNYQGEENDIILLSLVRSNMQGSIGFLRTDNRVCVALSRAKHALFCIGNFVQLAENSKLWNNIVQYLGAEKMIDTGMVLNSNCTHPKYEKVGGTKII